MNKKAQQEYKTIFSSLGAEGTFHYHVGQKLVAIVFENEPDRTIYNKVANGWYPKKSSKKDKDHTDPFIDFDTDHIGFDMNIDHLCWEPTEDMEEVKRWQVEKHLDGLFSILERRVFMSKLF